MRFEERERESIKLWDGTSVCRGREGECLVIGGY